MIETGILPACAKDIAKYATMKELAGDREATYKAIKAETDKLKAIVAKRPSDLHKDAAYLCDTVKPQMLAVRAAVDKAEGLIEASLYPYPTYEAMLYSHHS
jgi:glutamine synthetase